MSDPDDNAILVTDQKLLCSDMGVVDILYPDDHS